VLGTLSQHQRERYGQHVRNCAACADELELLNAAVAVPELMATRPVRPPSEHELQPDGGRRSDSEYKTGHSGQKRAQSHPDPFGDSTKNTQRKRRRLHAPIPKPAITALLGLLIVAALTVYMSHQAVSTTFARGDTAWPNTPAGIALQLQGSHGELLLNHIPNAPAGEHYEVWYLPAHATVLTKLNATLKLNADGQAGVLLPGDIHDYTAIGVYPIPDASSTVPRVSDHPVAVVYVPASGQTASGQTASAKTASAKTP